MVSQLHLLAAESCLFHIRATLNLSILELPHSTAGPSLKALPTPLSLRDASSRLAPSNPALNQGTMDRTERVWELGCGESYIFIFTNF